MDPKLIMLFLLIGTIIGLSHFATMGGRGEASNFSQNSPKIPQRRNQVVTKIR
jgi:hypothetical protein